LRELVEENGGEIDVYTDSVVVRLNGKAQRYYYNINSHKQTHENFMYDGSMYVDAIEFAKYFDIINHRANVSEVERVDFYITISEGGFHGI